MNFGFVPYVYTRRYLYGEQVRRDRRVLTLVVLCNFFICEKRVRPITLYYYNAVVLNAGLCTVSAKAVAQ